MFNTRKSQELSVEEIAHIEALQERVDGYAAKTMKAALPILTGALGIPQCVVEDAIPTLKESGKENDTAQQEVQPQVTPAFS